MCGHKLTPAAGSESGDPQYRAIEAGSGPVAPSSPVVPATSAERKSVTVMFCDVVGSTSLSASLDPEDLAAILRSYRDRVSNSVDTYGGFVAQYMGDGALVYYGYPTAQENDAERAISSALALVESCRSIDVGGEGLQVRVGISTGHVVVGEMIGKGFAQMLSIIGETPNRAARLQAIAGPGEIVVDDLTQRIVGKLFLFADLGEHLLKGFANPIRCWRVVASGGLESRFAALRLQAQGSLVGRTVQLQQLLSLAQRARRGEGNCALISADAGMGKSRLVESLVENSELTPLRFFCSPLHTRTAFYPFIRELEAAAGVRPGQPSDEKSKLIHSKLGRLPSLDRDRLATLVGLVTGSPDTSLSGSPQELRRRIEAALKARIEGLAAESPLLVIIEDAHWADSNSRDVIASMITLCAGLPMAVVVTSRPELADDWSHHQDAMPINLAPLAPADAGLLAQATAGRKRLPPGLVDRIVSRTDGVPLFIEELTRAMLESGVLEETPDEYVFAQDIADLAIPDTLQASLLSRLDRLGSAKETAQIAATIGREFFVDLLRRIAEQDEAQLDADLQILLQSGLIESRTELGRAYAFRHALLQEAAYSTLLRSRRQQLHGGIARTLERFYPDIVDNQPAVLAHHFTEGDCMDRALAYWARAGDLTASRASYPDACRLFETALTLIPKLSDPIARDRHELGLRLRYGAALSVARGPAAEEVEQTYAAADKLASTLGDPASGFKALWGLYYNHLGRGQMRQAHDEAGRLVELSKTMDDEVSKVEAQHARWTTAHFRGRPSDARRHIQESLRLYDESKHDRRSIAFSGHHPGACGRAIMSMSLLTLGFPVQALAMAEDALIYSNQCGHAFSEAWAGWMSATTYQIAGDASRCHSIAEKVVRLSQQHGYATAGPIAEMLLLWSQLEMGFASPADAAREMRRSLDRGGPNHRLGPWWHGLISSVCMRAGELDAAHKLLARGIGLAAETGLGFALPELHRLLGECVLQLGSVGADQVADHFCMAISIAREQKTKLFELRAATALTLLCEDQKSARNHLAPVYEWFSEGQQFADLVKARDALHRFGIPLPAS